MKDDGNIATSDDSVRMFVVNVGFTNSGTIYDGSLKSLEMQHATVSITVPLLCG